MQPIGTHAEIVIWLRPETPIDSHLCPPQPGIHPDGILRLPLEAYGELTIRGSADSLRDLAAAAASIADKLDEAIAALPKDER